MTRLPLVLFALLFVALSAGGCADGNADAPRVDEAHPPNWVLQHAAEARQRLADCASCHGPDFQGAGEAVSCFVCHFGGPPQFGNFFIHPPEWGENVVAGHQTFPQAYSWTTCGNGACHGTDLRGGLTSPSCFLAQCHAQGPPAPHPTGLFFQPESHGPTAQNNQLFCRNCHGRPPFFFDGGFVTDVRIVGQQVGNCSLSFCHPAAMAHPTNWQGENDPGTGLGSAYFASHRDIDRGAIVPSCALCHDVDNAGPSPLAPAPTCFAGQFTNADGSTTVCHPGGP